MINQDNRISWLDISKGFVILLMIVGHSSMPQWISQWIWSFHMPFFFFVSGLMYVPGRPFLKYLKYEACKLLWPFFTCSIMVLLISYIYEQDWLSYVLRVAIRGWGGNPLWFVPVLFFVRLLLFLFCNTANKNFILFGILISISLATVFCSCHIELPYNMSSVFFATAFAISGFLLKKLIFSLLVMKSINLVFICCGLFMINIYISTYWRLDMCINQIRPAIPLYAGALCGVFAIIICSMLLQERRIRMASFLKNCGKNTFLLMAFASPIMCVWISIVGRSVFSLVLLSTCLRYILLSVSLYLIIRFINRHTRWLLYYDNLIRNKE